MRLPPVAWATGARMTSIQQAADEARAEYRMTSEGLQTASTELLNREYEEDDLERERLARMGPESCECF
jgi:hypothetical protein